MRKLDTKWWTLIAVSTATFMLLLDITIVNVALPSIQRSLHATFSDLQWVVDAYALTLAAFMLTAGVIGDMFGRREMFAAGLAVFSAASFVCGVAVNSLMLDLSRAVQGVGGAVMFATSLALIADAFRGRDRGTAFGVYGAVIGGAIAIGPLVGGAITTGVGWRWIFFVNVPIGVVAIVMTLARVERSKDPTGRRVDWLGFITFSGALFLLVLALIRGDTDGWSSALVTGLFAGAALLLVVFLTAELRQRAPMLDLALFKRPAMIGVSAAAFCVSASIFALFLYITLYLQDVLGFGAFGAGLRFLSISMLAFLVAPIAGKLTVRLDARYMLGSGLLLAGVACVLLSFVTPTSTWTALLPGFIVGGVAIGMVNPVLASSAVAVVRPERSGMASGANNTFRQVGVATGIAALGTIFASHIKGSVATTLAASSAGRAVLSHSGPSLATALESGEVRTVVTHMPHAQAQALLHAYQRGFTNAFDVIALVAAGIAFAGAAAAFGLVRQRDFALSHGHGEPSVQSGSGGRADGGTHAPAANGAGTAPARQQA